ncbi:MAG TPA: type II secretion system protein [Tepidisphaeraceae bacterium]|jgi:prepilin-type N-terminal cleavage/methylation domain-containing protein/prepilin-type processing-associated H-X9-DG protein|nr:type II secretion system protein [Tepidisphaeraceae bacterium]
MKRGSSFPVRLRSGFTLLELLVVIGIILVLAGLIYPITTRVIQQSRAVRCASQERQIYAATMSYVMDNNGYLPYASMIGWGTMDRPYAFTTPSLGIISFTDGVIWQYLGTSPQTRQQIMNCPADFEEHPNNQPTVTRNFSYSYNAGLTWYNGGYDDEDPPKGTQLPFAAIKNGSHKVLLWEEVGPNDGACWCLGGDRDDYPSQRHMIWGKHVSDNGQDSTIHGSGMGNQCFADGHVEMLEPAPIWSVPAYCDLRAP